MPLSALSSMPLISLLSPMAVRMLRTKPGAMRGPPNRATLLAVLASDCSAEAAYALPRVTLPAPVPGIETGCPAQKTIPQASHSYFLSRSHMHTGRPVGSAAPPAPPGPRAHAAARSSTSCRSRAAPALAGARESIHMPLTSQSRLPNLPVCLGSGCPFGQRCASYAANVPSVGSQLDAPLCPFCPPRGRFFLPPSRPASSPTTSPPSP